VLAAAAWLHTPALRLPFFADDYLFLDQVRSRSLIATLLAPDPIGNFFRPVGRQIHFWWLSHASGESPFAFHLANLVLFLGILVLLHALARRNAGPRAALIATGIAALHYAADVPVRWASGAQDLLAVAFALAAMLFHVTGRALLAGVLLVFALLSKETVALTPAIAVLLARAGGEPWRAAVRRAWPMAAAALLVALLWVSGGTRVRAAGETIGVSAAAPFATLAHLAQTVTGIEWPTKGKVAWPKAVAWGPLALVVVATTAGVWGARGAAPRAQGAAERHARGGRRVAPVTPTNRARAAHAPERRVAIAGIGWALLATLPVAAVVASWSAYYYLFAVCGAALAIGAALAAAPAGAAIAVVTLLGLSSQVGRHLDEFATVPGEWNSVSRINPFYLDRSMSIVARYLEDMRTARPTLPAGSTVFFSGVPGFIAWQAADGPLVRWAYRDSSLRSYYLSSFSLEQVGRGPTYFFAGRIDSLSEVKKGPQTWNDVGTSMMFDEKLDAARDAWTLQVREHPEDREARYRLGMMQVLAGDSSGAGILRELGVTLGKGPSPAIEPVFRRFTAGDTAGAFRDAVQALSEHGADPGLHALIADIALARPLSLPLGYFEAWVAFQLGPQHPRNVRRWGLLLAEQRRYERAVALLERYLASGNDDPEVRAQIRRWVTEIRRHLPGGDLAGEQLRLRKPQ
jgi:hypothetical protein